MSDLHGEIMNIPCDPSRAPVAGVNAELAYKYGHRDARHAAAELAAAHGAERAQPEEAEWVVFGFDDRYVKVSQEAYSIFLARERHHLAALSAVTAERDRLRKDAERYRKLKSAGPSAAGWLAMTKTSARWDEAIDEHLAPEAAMAAKEA
ncbi:hypothetical protein [Stutzerimonas balearica]|uniref:hypothetical protein n=1 Tax=Stutzerimonas balearica TaxID=74829 RepID=UPI00289F147A|nr:hypothetical protein [Stutzerimonas balearica]